MKKSKISLISASDLPEQQKFFATEKLKRSARAGTHLPDPTMTPFGYDPKSQFKHIFPELHLPPLMPPKEVSHDDYVSFGHPELPDNRLYFGDNLYILRNLPSESIDLIYIDPPFFSNRDYVQIWGDDNEVRSFEDIFGDGMFSYLAWLNARLWEMKRVLKNTGSIYVHCDWHASHYIKTEMDKIFGYDNFQNEIIWYYKGNVMTGVKTHLPRKHDTVLLYTKSKVFHFKQPRYAQISQDMINRWGKYFDKDNNIMFGQIKHENPTYGRLVNKFKKAYGRAPLDTDIAWHVEGSLVRDVWDDIPEIRQNERYAETLGYPTQKPEALLDRIIKTSTKQGDIVADFFMGGGTTGAVALKHDRRFVGSDISRVAVSVAYNRLVEVAEQLSGIDVTDTTSRLQLETKALPDLRVGYVGSYPTEKFEGISDDEFQEFVINLYGGNKYTGQHSGIHGLANGKIVIHVGPSSPKQRVQLDHVKQALQATLQQYNKQLASGEDKILQVIGWGFDPTLQHWKVQATNTLNKKGIKLTIEFISLSSEQFRQKIFRNVGDSNIDLKFNRLNQLLSFTNNPIAGTITVRKQSGTELEFELVGSEGVGAGSRLINCQWDFDYRDNRFSDKRYALNRKKLKSGTYEAVFTVSHKFDKPGEYIIAARVQDNQDGENTVVNKLTLAENDYKLEIVK